jgi:CRISPR/Cas system-associated exonuclease Cas4 (RecB family)
MFYQSADTHGQVYAARTVIEEKLEKKLPLDEKTVIVLPSSDTLFPVLRQGLAGIDESSYNISLGYPLFRTPVYGFINALMDVVSAMEDNRVYVPHYLRFVLHPYTKNIYFDGHSEITRIIFHTIEEFLLANRTRTFVTLSEIEDNEQIVTSVLDHVSGEDNALTPDRIRDHIRTIHHHTIGRFIGFENVKDFAERGITILSYIYQNSTARQHPLFHPFSEAFINSLETLAGSLMKDIAFSSQGSYFLFLRKYIATIHTPFEGTPVRGIQVLGFLETRCLHFDTVLLMDTNEEVIPDTQKEDTLLPHKARQMLGLPTYTERDQLTAYYFDLLVRGAGEVHIFFSENEKKEKSRFVEKLLWEKQKRDQTKESKQYINLIQYRVKLENKSPRAIQKTESVAAFLSDFLFTATALDSYLRCPAQFYYSYVLNLGKKDEMTGDIQRSDTGTFVHRVLTQYLSRRKGVPLREKDLNVHEMYRLIDTLFSESYGKNPAGAVYLLKKQLTRHLGDFLLRYYLPLVRKETVTILETEHDLRSQENFFRFRGRLDCIEKRGDTVFIIDFKTGSSMNRLKTSINNIEPLQRDTWSHAIGSLQLPCYLMLYSGHTGADIRGLNGMFLLLGRTVLQKDTIELPLFESDCDPVESFGILKQVIMSLIREIQDQSHPFIPTTLKKELCPSCDFRYLCGTQWHIRQR